MDQRSNLKISVIIPVYKAEKYLGECVDSILNQTYKEVEVVLVDDGSPDRCPEICDSYAERDPRVSVIHKKNGGTAAARNTGLLASTGDYVLFLDDDDFFDDVRSCEILVDRLKARPSDVLNFGLYKYYNGKKTPYFKPVKSMPLDISSRKDQFAYLTDNGLYIPLPGIKLIRRELLQHITFVPGVGSEDIEWAAHLMRTAESMDFIENRLCCYREHPDSSSRTLSAKNLLDLKNNIIAVIQTAQSADTEIQTSILKYGAWEYATFIAAQASMGEFEKERRECIDALSEYQWILSYHGGNKKVRVLYMGCRLLGYSNLCALMKKTKSLWRKKIV